MSEESKNKQDQQTQEEIAHRQLGTPGALEIPKENVKTLCETYDIHPKYEQLREALKNMVKLADEGGDFDGEPLDVIAAAREALDN
jgi:hypothetical protein